ncbi:MAG TPA: tetratricopeptide repeat protein [Verrucomicrobiae bacterium]|nr:tetratricopeptide repeat protein [Verrucomicrobiae bacterium]
MTEAIEHLEQQVQLKPDSVELHQSVAVALALAGRNVEAIEQYQQVVRSQPNDAVTSAQKAIELANSAGLPQVVKEIEPRLQLYRNGQAYREAVDVTSPPKP